MHRLPKDLHDDNCVIEIGAASLVLEDPHRVEAALKITENVNAQRAVFG
jgi:hypothetical protein